MSERTTDPSPLGEAPRLRQLIEKWRADGRAERDRLAGTEMAGGGVAMWATYDQCADELEELLVAEGAARGPQPEEESYRQRYETLKAYHDAGTEAIYSALGASKHGAGAFKAALQAVKGLQERVRFTADYEHLRDFPAAPLVRSSAPPEEKESDHVQTTSDSGCAGEAPHSPGHPTAGQAVDRGDGEAVGREPAHDVAVLHTVQDAGVDVSDVPRGWNSQTVEALAAFGAQEAESALKAKDREQYQFWQGWNAALARLAGAGLPPRSGAQE